MFNIICKVSSFTLTYGTYEFIKTGISTSQMLAFLLRINTFLSVIAETVNC